MPSHLFAKARLKGAKKPVPAWVSDPRIEPPLPEPAPRCWGPHCRTMYFRRRLDCSVCGRPAPEAAQPVYHRPPPPPPKWASGETKRSLSNMDRLHHRTLCMTTEQIEIALKMETDGKTQKEIATLFGIDQSSVSRALARYPDTRATARRQLIASATTAATHVLKAMKEAADRGDGTVALELLDRLDVLPSKKHSSDRNGAPSVVVVVGAPPNTPININALPVFDADELPVAE